MADTYHIIIGQVVQFNGGRKCNNTDAWRDATPLDLQLQEQLAESKHVIVVQAAEIEALREEVERLRADRGSREKQTAHPAITHCDNCGCDWLDNGLNPIGCPYCKQHAQVAEIKTLLVEVDELREALKDIRSLSFINSAMQPNPLTLTAMLGDIHQIADSALSKGNSND